MSVITESQTEIIARTAMEFLRREEERQKKEKHDRRLRNIKLLLKNYRSFVIHCADIKLELNELNKKLELDELDTDEFAILSIMESKELTLAMVKYINKTLEIYKLICEKSENPEDTRRYGVVHDMYIGEAKMTVNVIAERHSVHKRTVHKDIDKACETLVVLMFGVMGIKLN